MLHYFAYGSNMDENQMEKRCPDSRLAGVGTLIDHKLVFSRYSRNRQCGVADVISARSEKVWGLLYEISDTDLERLDHSEGYPTAYNRSKTSVKKANGPVVNNVWIYSVVKKESFVPPSAEYISILKQAAEKYGFPREYLTSINRIRLQGD